MDILDKIEKLRKEKGWSKSKFAKNAELSQSTIASLYSRGNQPTLHTLQSVCKAFNISIVQFFMDGQEYPDLSEEQIELLKHWGTLTEEEKGALLLIIKSMGQRNT